MRLALALVLLILSASAAAAQLPDAPPSPTDEDIAAARDRFVHGMELAQRQEWTEALAEFVASYAQSGSPVALYNLGSALRALRRFREARIAFDRLLEDPELDPEMRTNAEEMRAEAAAQVAILTVEDVPDGPARVTADDALREITEVRPIEIELDPGPHTLLLELPPHGTWRWTGSMAQGAQERVTADFETGGAPATGGGGVDAVPIVVGIVLGVLAAGAIVAGVVADAEAQLDPRTPLVITLP
jgi:hypothetical protein